ncbi:hypothetical protein M0802_016587 [Mischocyttarus mexicanus]|nr:hypothetical protein M0802_016587 [Mischocyttarus mexicanus]
MQVGQGFSKLTVWFSQGQVKARTQLRKNKYRTVRALFSAKFQRLRQGFLRKKRQVKVKSKQSDRQEGQGSKKLLVWFSQS